MEEALSNKFSIVKELFFRNRPTKGIIRVPTSWWRAGMLCFPQANKIAPKNHHYTSLKSKFFIKLVFPFKTMQIKETPFAILKSFPIKLTKRILQSILLCITTRKAKTHKELLNINRNLNFKKLGLDRLITQAHLHTTYTATK